MARSSLKSAVSALALGISLWVSSPAGAIEAVIDQAAIAKLAEQLNKAQEQIEELQEANKFLNDQLEAVGRAGQINVPVLNFAKLGNRLARDADCLIPDFTKLLPEFDLEEISFGSICEIGAAYRQTLWVRPGDKVQLSPRAQAQWSRDVQKRRNNILADIATKGLAHGDVAAESAAELNEAAADLKSAADGSADINERLATIALGVALQVRGTAQQNQLISQLLKLQSAVAIRSLPFDSEAVTESEEEGAETAQNGGNQ